MSTRADASPGPRIEFQPMDETHDLAEGETLLDCARRQRIRMASVCGGMGKCMSCVVQFVDGEVPEPSAADRDAFSGEKLTQGWRRACQTRPTGDCVVYLPPRSTAVPVRTQLDGREIAVTAEPAVKTASFALDAPTLVDPLSDDLRLAKALGHSISDETVTWDIEALRGLAPAVRSWQWRGRASLRGGEVIALGPSSSRALGLAVDLGTTNVSAILVDFDHMDVLSRTGLENPQTIYGTDLIAYAALLRREPEKAATLQSLAAEAINEAASALCEECRVDRSEILDVTVAGNTMMHHLLLGLPIGQLGKSPFVPTLSSPLDVKAREIGIDVAAGAYVHLLPNIAGFVGGDHVATLLASAEAENDGPKIVMDIGTNTEISLVDAGAITSVSCPSGPALEGGHITHGMRAAVGAIEMVRVRGTDVQINTIGEVAPVGICGSGVVDVVAQLYLAGVLDRSGRIGSTHPRVRVVDGKRQFVVTGGGESVGTEIAFTQSDVRSVQLATGAIRASIDVLLANAGREENELTQIIIAGAFGNYIDVASALAIGMLPELPFKRFSQVGNAAGDGARMVLVSTRLRQQAADIARRCNYIELAGDQSFMKRFVQRMRFPDVHRHTAESGGT